MLVIKHSGWALLALALLALLTGCGEQRVLERLGFIQVVGYDPAPGDHLKVSFFLPKFSGEFRTTRGEFLSVIARSSKEAKLILGRRTNWELSSGQLRNALLAESLAQQGIWGHIDTLIRDPTISPRVKLSVVEGNTFDLLSKKYEQHPSTGVYVDHLLEEEIKERAIPRVSLFEFERDYLDDGIDPVAPVLKESGANLEVTGIGLFHGDKYMGKVKASEMPIFSLLYKNEKGLDLFLDLDKGEGDGGGGQSHVLLDSVRSSRKIRVVRPSTGPFAVQIRMNVTSSISEYQGDLKIYDDEQRRQLEKQIADQISAKAEAIVSFMQRKKADSLGLGKYVRNSMSYRDWRRLDWAETYPEIKINCLVKFTMTDYGRFR